MKTMTVTIQFTEADLFCGDRLKAIDRVEARMARARKMVLTEVIAQLSHMYDLEAARDMARQVVW